VSTIGENEKVRFEPINKERPMDTVNVIVEIPRDSKNKYEYDQRTHDQARSTSHRLDGLPGGVRFHPDTLGVTGTPSTRWC